jgi:Peptidase family M23
VRSLIVLLCEFTEYLNLFPLSIEGNRFKLKHKNRKVRSIPATVYIIGMLFSCIIFMLLFVNPDAAFASTFARECLDKLADPNSTSLDIYQCAYGECIINVTSSYHKPVCSILDASTMKFCPDGNSDFVIGCPRSAPQVSKPQPISAQPPLPKWTTLCTTRDYSTNIGTAAKPELHGALDIPVPKGTPVLAPIDGIVVGKVNIIGKEGRTGYQSMGGNVLYIMSTDEIHLFDFGHLQNGLPIPGTPVMAGSQIATSGSTGTTSAAPHPHFSYHIREKDPINNTWSPFILQDPYKAVVNRLKSCRN